MFHRVAISAVKCVMSYTTLWAHNYSVLGPTKETDGVYRLYHLQQVLQIDQQNTEFVHAL